ARRIAFRVAPETPVGEVMTAPVRTARDGERLHAALARMRRARLDHLVVVDESGRLVGTLALADATAAMATGLIRQIDRLTIEPVPDSPRRVKEGQAHLARALLDDGVPATDALRLLSDLNDAIYGRVIEDALAQMAEAGWGAPPRPFAAIVMGSAGRGESLLRPDQDNGFVIADYPDAEHTPIDRFFIELAGRMTRGLDAIGFPFCNGFVMATNPIWRKTLPQWQAQIDGWSRLRDPVALLHADIFYDFQVAWGPAALGAALRRHVLAVARQTPRFLRDMATNESHHMVGLGWFKRFVTDPDEGPHQGEINLKRNALLPIVEAVRLYALREGVAATNTQDRIAALANKGVFSRDERAALSGAFEHVAELLLRGQIADTLAGRKPSAYVAPDALPGHDKDILALAMKAVDRLNTRLRADFTGGIL
ncbi:MAG: CBS domain-containing protein, partial [Alphaproteobacteria bacterium]|nr:CBS domain-containing protein [Alphaproteobacteria bacterium]